MLQPRVARRLGSGAAGFPPDDKGLATREASRQTLNASAQHVPWLVGGSADLAPSCKTRLTFEGAGDFSAANPGGRNLHFGIREHAMGAIAQRPVAVEDSSLWLRLPDLQRLRPRADSTRRDDGAAGHPRLHARLNRRRRRRADAPADRAARVAARDSRADHAASGRRQRSRRSVARDYGAATPAGGIDSHASGSADTGSRPLRVRRRCTPRGVHPDRRAGAAIRKCC